ncbi:hypothetical protein [Pseudemcibacter sp.]|uniref:hypothetical protein n=1 Tax=Pseudemcibacter sp. TaxID=2943293 RepID=UPI003F69A2C7
MTNIFKTILITITIGVIGFSIVNAQENPFGTEGINHTGLAVSRLDESVSFLWKGLAGKKWVVILITPPSLLVMAKP